MKITDILTTSVKLEGTISNAVVSFDDHDVSLVAVVSDVVRNGRPVTGIGFKFDWPLCAAGHPAGPDPPRACWPHRPRAF